MYDNLLKYALACFSVFATISIGLMLFYASNQEVVYAKKIVLTDDKIIAEEEITLEGKKVPLDILQGKDKGVDFIIPLGVEITYEDIVIENDYIEEILYLEIKGLEEGHFEEFLMSGSGNYVLAAFSQYNEGVTSIELQMKSIFEYTVILKNNMLYLKFVEPSSVYDKIVVIDINTTQGSSVTDEEISKKIKSLLDGYGIFGYYLGADQKLIDGSIKAEVANKVNADMLISIDVKEQKIAEESQEVNGLGVKAIYNHLYFIPYFGSIELSDIMERNVSQEMGLFAIGLEASDEKDSVVMETEVPATRIEITCMAQEVVDKEEAVIQKTSEQIAIGIVNGILESYQYLQGE